MEDKSVKIESRIKYRETKENTEDKRHIRHKNNNKCANAVLEEERENEVEAIFEEIMTGKFSKLLKNIKP